MSTKSIKRNYIYNLSYQIIALLTPLLVTPYVSRVLGADGIGIYSYTQSIISYFVLLGTIGISMYGQREIAYVQNDKVKQSMLFYELILLRFVTTSVSISLCYLTVLHGLYRSLFLIQLLDIIAATFDISWFFQGLEEFKRIVVRNIFCKVTGVVLIFIFIKNANDLSLYILIYSVSSLIANLSLWIYLPKYLLKVSFSELHVFKHFIPSLGLFIPMFAIQIYTVMDKTLIGIITQSTYENGYYEQSQKIVKMALTIIISYGTVMMPRMAFVFANKDTEGIKYYINRSFKFVWFLGIPIMFGLIGTSSTFVPWYFGSGCEKVVKLIIVFSPTILIIGLSNVISIQYLIPVGQQNLFTITVIIGALLDLFLNLILIRKYQSMGAAFSSVAAESLITIIQFLYLKKIMQIKPIFKDSLNYLFSGIVMFVIIFLLGKNLKAEVLSTVLQIVIGTIVYFALLLLLKDSISTTSLKSVIRLIRRMKSSVLFKIN